MKKKMVVLVVLVVFFAGIAYFSLNQGSMAQKLSWMSGKANYVGVQEPPRWQSDNEITFLLNNEVSPSLYIYTLATMNMDTGSVKTKGMTEEDYGEVFRKVQGFGPMSNPWAQNVFPKGGDVFETYVGKKLVSTTSRKTGLTKFVGQKNWLSVNEPSWSKDGLFIIYNDKRGQVILSCPSGHQEISYPSGKGFAWHGSRVAFIDFPHRQIIVGDVAADNFKWVKYPF